MNSNISNRHRGDLGGRFTDVRMPAKVIVSLSRDAAENPVAQHLTWMLLNLLARQTAEIQEIELNIPEKITTLKRLSPLISRNDDFLEAVCQGIEDINPTVLEPKANARSVVFIRIGPGDLEKADLSLATSADGWSGYVGQLPTAILGQADNPIGAYVAASLCTGEVFKFVRAMRNETGKFAESLWLDAYNFKVHREPIKTPALISEIILPQTILAGVGAVGNGFLQTLYSFTNISGEIVAIDDDDEGITETNLNRYVLFGLPQIQTRQLKATTVADMFQDTAVKIKPFDYSWQKWRGQNPNEPLNVVISAVDKNSARHAIQDSLPRFILGASTNEMRAQVNLYDVFNNESPCLKCRNKVEQSVPDDLIIERLRSLSDDDLRIEADRCNIDFIPLKKFLADPKANCGKISGSSLQKFADNTTAASWSVGFVSFLAGVLLAAEYLKHSSGEVDKKLGGHENMFRFQFWFPENDKANALVNLPPETNCICRTAVYQQVISNLIKSKV